MKRFLILALALILILPVLAGCQNSAPSANNANNTPQSAQGSEIQKRDVLRTPDATTVSTFSDSSSLTQIDRTNAGNIALKHAGLDASQVRDLEVELDREGGKTHYDVDFEYNGYDYDYEIDAVSGKILKSRKEKD